MDKNKWYDAFTRSSTEGDDLAQLRGLFVESVLHNVERVHAIRFLAEDHDMGGMETETDHLVEVTFTNGVGATVAVDGILEKFNMADWRVICDKFCERMLTGVGEDPEPWEWETPRPHVTYVPGWDGDDIVDTVTLVWRVPEALWNRVRGFWETKSPKPVEVDEVCPRCGREVRMPWDVGLDGTRAFCPYCGSLMKLCSECGHDAADCAECEKDSGATAALGRRRRDGARRGSGVRLLSKRGRSGADCGSGRPDFEEAAE